MDARLVWIWLSNACGQGSRNAVRLLLSFNTPEDVYKASAREIRKKYDKCDERLLERLEDKRLDEAERIVDRCAELGIQILTPRDPLFPRSLLALRDAPMVLYTVGTLPDFSEYFACAVVGTRSMSPYGRRMAYEIGSGFGAGGAVLVSGLALGIDGMSMAGALDAGGTVVGVLGCGVDVTYPAEHRDLMRRVIEHGAIVSEYPTGTPPEGRHFPVRNRIISGLAQATVVVEGDMNSGSLITARHAVYQGKELYAVPGQIGDPGSAGPNSLIAEGARAITGAVDVLDRYAFLYPMTISLPAAEYAAMRSGSEETLEHAAERSGIGVRGGKKQYGTGVYGGSRKEMKRISSRQAVKEIAEAGTGGKPETGTAEAKPQETSPEPPPAPMLSLDSLSDKDRKVFAAMKPDVPMLADDISVPGMGVSDVLASLTMLELAGEVESGAGGYFLRRGADDYFHTISEEAD